MRKIVAAAKSRNSQPYNWLTNINDSDARRTQPRIARFPVITRVRGKSNLGLLTGFTARKNARRLY
jgi:hypothetical protein